MMQQRGSYDDVNGFGSDATDRLGARRIALTFLLLAGVAAAAAVGYASGRGAAKIQAPYAAWLPLAARPPAEAGSRSELKNYGFELVQGEMKQGIAVLDVRLIDRRTGQAVPDAVVFARRLDMAPDGMPSMKAPLESEPPPEPGVYRFRTELAMEGGWQLSLAGKVQGETGTVQSKLVFKATP